MIRVTIAINALAVSIAIPSCLFNAVHHEQVGYWFGVVALVSAVISLCYVRRFQRLTR
jgi:hypothetical protein